MRRHGRWEAAPYERLWVSYIPNWPSAQTLLRCLLPPVPSTNTSHFPAPRPPPKPCPPGVAHRRPQQRWPSPLGTHRSGKSRKSAPLKPEEKVTARELRGAGRDLRPSLKVGTAAGNGAPCRPSPRPHSHVRVTFPGGQQPAGPPGPDHPSPTPFRRPCARACFPLRERTGMRPGHPQVLTGPKRNAELLSRPDRTLEQSSLPVSLIPRSARLWPLTRLTRKWAGNSQTPLPSCPG